eukprot:ctg_998.g371
MIGVAWGVPTSRYLDVAIEYDMQATTVTVLVLADAAGPHFKNTTSPFPACPLTAEHAGGPGAHRRDRQGAQG